MKSSQEIREDFLNFFKKHGHKIVGSAPVIPHDDPTLIFTNAGMNQFKKIFLDVEPVKFPRIVNSQKCIRVSGKHNDLEEVGKDTCHHTFFEMLGNWSFGDYYKAEAIEWAWELFTNIWKFSKERLWATVYEKDDESAELWTKVTDISPDRVLRFGKKDNFWEMGETGPCGPCSEIHYYTGTSPESQSADKINSNDPEYIELWNLVFIQYNCDEKGILCNLSSKHVDTGAGLERIVAALQGRQSNYDTDLFVPIINTIEELTGIKYLEETGMSHRVISDHIRMLSFAIADGGMPSNDGRGYVIRRILRRAARFGRKLNMHEPFVYQLIEPLCETLGEVFPEIVEQKEHIKHVIKAEEKSFGNTLDRGLEQFSKITDKLKKQNKITIPCSDVFKLYDTYGFPLDLTRLLAEEKGMTIDETGFHKKMEEQRKRARESKVFHLNIPDYSKKWIHMTEGDDSKFIGYETGHSNSIIRRYLIEKGKVHIVLDKTPFYAESGGQVGDTGKITGKDFTIAVENTIKINNSIIHVGTFQSGQVGDNPEIHAEINAERRRRIMLNHTTTHLLHAALRKVLGNHVHQSGSLVDPDRLRFDLTHYARISDEELRMIENLVNQKIRENIKLDISWKSYDEARKSGAMALFGEKYGDSVRVVQTGDFSIELCGGTHVNRTGDIGYFKIISEGSVASGIRRIVALTSSEAIESDRQDREILNELEDITGVTKDKLASRIKQLQKDIKSLKKSLKEINSHSFEKELQELINSAPKLGDLKIFTHRVEANNIEDLKKTGDIVRAYLKNGVGVLASVFNNKPQVLIVVPDYTIKKYGIKACDLVKPLGKILGGGGGGRHHMAIAGGKYPEMIPEVFKKVHDIVEEIIGGGKNKQKIG